MSHSEFIEWLEYLSTPSIQEIQTAHFMYLFALHAGIKNITINDFLINKIKTEEKTEPTEEEINRIAGVE
jgi:formiminotetrahydrofolate cyclodeaminase